MHDIDRMTAEYASEADALRGESLEFAFEGGGGFAGEGLQEGPLPEALETELAAELLEVSTEAELDRFLGNLLGRVAGAASRFASSPTGRALGGILKGAARKALPVIGRGIGSYVGGDRGGDFGAQVGTAAGRLFGLELEGLPAEDREFEAARRFVRFAGDAALRAAQARPTADPAGVVRPAVIAAAQRHAPGLLRALDRGAAAGAPRPAPAGRSGRWIRRGNRILLLGA